MKKDITIYYSETKIGSKNAWETQKKFLVFEETRQRGHFTLDI